MDFSQQLPIVIHSLNIGFLQTLRLFGITLIGACPLGLAICFGSMSRIKPVSAFFKLLIWVVRGTPLMIQRIIPPMSNEILTLVKDTSLARIIALQEIIWAGQAFMKGSQGISGQIWPLFFTAIYYLIFNGILTVVLGKLEKKLDYFR